MASSSPFRFSTKYQDEETGLVYYGYRYYDADTGRWLSKDPIDEVGGLNAYGFVNNDPVHQTDYNGLEIGSVCPTCGQYYVGVHVCGPLSPFDLWTNEWVALSLEVTFGREQFKDDSGNWWDLDHEGLIQPSFAEGGLNLARLARCCRIVGLAAQEGGITRGHTLAKHVGKDAAWLRARLARESLKAASSFYSREIAEHVLATTIRAHGREILKWLGETGATKVVTQHLGAEVGIIVRSGSSAVEKATKVSVVLKREKCGFRILTVMLDV